MRDIKADYRRAYVEEYESYQRAGRGEDAERVAAILREQYGHEVAPGAKPKPAQDAPERADKERPAENTAEPKPAQRTAAKRTPAKKPAGE